ncbi:LacI family transcriptional regulator [Nocardioides gansuensis]|uniref:LacI family transcriptional regulator n=1 Tax=Nocardioides gansuensis TaxID=2138300 RepID=A0A2T8F6F5_9ACTN|nr:LacI family DNA-binding transcriptional regulator [Nocardioides gansuensis]PVG81290.1 LacI family transcriptional regulator [Nocardioides gansuensis]
MTETTRRPSGHATLRDVAALAGVSIKTVSRVVNHEPGVMPDKVVAVERAMRMLDYRPNLAASSLRRADGRTATIAALLEDIANPFSAEIHRALEDVARQRGVLILAGSVEESPETERALVRAFTARRVDALVIASATENQGYLEREVSDGTPVVFVDRTPVGFAADSVVTDNAAGAGRAVAHLVTHGHQRIAFLGDLRTITTERERHTGFMQAMTERGLPVRSDHVAHDLHTELDTENAVQRILTGDDAPTALFAAQNNITVATVRCLQRLGLEHEVALVGFDDFPLADLVRPGVTVMAQDPSAIGRLAGEIVFARLAGDDSPAECHVVPTQLVVRGSGEIPPPAS